MCGNIYIGIVWTNDVHHYRQILLTLCVYFVINHFLLLLQLCDDWVLLYVTSALNCNVEHLHQVFYYFKYPRVKTWWIKPCTRAPGWPLITVQLEFKKNHFLTYRFFLQSNSIFRNLSRFFPTSETKCLYDLLFAALIKWIQKNETKNRSEQCQTRNNTIGALQFTLFIRFIDTGIFIGGLRIKYSFFYHSNFKYI